MSPKILSFGPLFVNAVQSPNAPKMAPVLLNNVSTRCPIVILLGIACGFTIISGFIPSAVVGISSSFKIIPIVPFCPALEQNLSPIFGILEALILTLAMRCPSSPSVKNALSTIPVCAFLHFIEASIKELGSSMLFMAFPIIIVLSFKTVFSFIIPVSLSNLL